MSWVRAAAFALIVRLTSLPLVVPTAAAIQARVDPLPRGAPHSKYHRAHNDGIQGSDQDGTRGYVLGFLNQGVTFRNGSISKKFNRGIERFRDPYQSDR